MNQTFVHLLNPSLSNRPLAEVYFTKNDHLNYFWVNRSLHPTHLETLVEWVHWHSYRKIAVWGGDGTLNRVIQKLFEFNALSEYEIAIIPVGTSNDFARRMGLRYSLEWVWKVQKGEGDIKNVDLGVVELEGKKRIFINNAGFGREPKSLSLNRPKALLDILNRREKNIIFEWEDGTTHQFAKKRVLFGMVFNAPFFSKGLYFDKNINPQDGVLDCVLVPPQGTHQLIYRFVKGRLGRSLSHKTDFVSKGFYFNIQSDMPLYPQADGEKITKNGINQIKFSIIPKVLRLYLPPEGEGR